MAFATASDVMFLLKSLLRKSWVCVGLAVAFAGPANASPPATANRLAYLDDCDPFYAQLQFPRLTTPQWIGDSGVEGAVILAIDDMRSPGAYETFLRPILERLKQINGGAPVSIMCVQIDPNDPRYQQWLQEGLSLEVHTLRHIPARFWVKVISRRRRRHFSEASRTLIACPATRRWLFARLAATRSTAQVRAFLPSCSIGPTIKASF